MEPVVPETVNVKNQKKEERMSTQEVKKPEVEKISRTFKFYNLDDLKAGLQEVEVKDIEFVPAADTKEAYSRLGNDEAFLLQLLNNALREQAILEAKKLRLPANMAPKVVVLNFIKALRQSPMFSALVTTQKGKDKNWKPEYDAQTTKILEAIQPVDFMMQNLRAMAASAPDSDDDNEE
jgi:hypothetical protein